MDDNILLMIILAFIVGYCLQGMMGDMCGRRLFEGSEETWEPSAAALKDIKKFDCDCAAQCKRRHDGHVLINDAIKNFMKSDYPRFVYSGNLMYKKKSLFKYGNDGLLRMLKEYVTDKSKEFRLTYSGGLGTPDITDFLIIKDDYITITEDESKNSRVNTHNVTKGEFFYHDKTADIEGYSLVVVPTNLLKNEKLPQDDIIDSLFKIYKNDGIDKATLINVVEESGWDEELVGAAIGVMYWDHINITPDTTIEDLIATGDIDGNNRDLAKRALNVALRVMAM